MTNLFVLNKMLKYKIPYSKSKEKEEYADSVPPERKIHGLQGFSGAGTQKVAFPLKKEVGGNGWFRYKPRVSVNFFDGK